jgi:hypothetical protein
VHAAPQALQAVQPVLGQPGLELAVGLDLFLQRLEGLQRADRSAWRAPSVHGLLALRRSSSSCGTLSCSSCSAASAISASSAPRPAAAQVVQARSSGAARALRSARRRSRGFPAGGCSSMLRCSAASTWICCCTCTTAALLVGGPGPGAARLPGRAAHGLLFELGGQHLGLLFGIHALPARFRARLGLFAALPLGDLLGQLHQALLHALAAFDHVADLGLQPADLGVASYSLPWAWLTWSPAA